MHSLLFKYLKDISIYHREIYDNLKVEIQQKIYSYGPNFKYTSEKRNIWYKLFFLKMIFMAADTLKTLPSNVYRSLKYKILEFIKRSKKIGPNLENKKSKSKVMLSDRSFSLDKNLEKLGFDVVDSPRGFGGIRNISSIKTFIQTMKLRKYFFFSNFKELISKDSIDMILKYKKRLKKIIQENNIKALFVCTTENFFESLAVDVFRELGKPSFEFTHGLPGVYWNHPHKGNYTLVWGEKMKENFIKIGGMDPNKIFVSGHPHYNTLSDKKLRFGLEDVLVLTKALSWGPRTTYNELDIITSYDKVGTITSDIGNSVGYLYSIKNTLNKLGVTSVRLRVHPCENIHRYKKFIDTDFFVFDMEPLSESLNKSSLIIGPGSTVILEAIYHDVNYLLYEPQENNVDSINFPLVPPYDISDPKLPVATNEEELYTIIKNKKMVDKTIFNDYVKTPFDINFLKGIIE